jgi:YD repeat-containing protein
VADARAFPPKASTRRRAGNQTAAIDADSSATPAQRRTIASTYDALSRPIAVTDKSGAITHSATTYAYSLTELERADPAGSSTLTLDPDGRQVSLADPLTSTVDDFAWEYGLNGAVAAMVDPTANRTDYTYDALGRLTGLSFGGSTACPACVAYTYAYNAAGDRIASSARFDTATITTAYGYDALGRLTSFDPTGTSLDQSYAWDSTPDRTSIKFGSGDPVLTA